MRLRRPVEPPAELDLQRAGAGAQPPRQRGDGQGRVQRRFHDGLGAGGQRVMVQCGAPALRAGGRGREIVDEGSRHPARQRRPVGFADDMQHHLDGRGGTGAGEAGAAGLKPGVHHVDLGKGAGEQVEVFPMGRSLPPVEQPGARHHPWSAVDPRDAAAPRREPPQAGRKRGGGLRFELEAGQNKQQIRAVQPVDRTRRDGQPAGQPHGRLRWRDELPVE